MATHLVSGSTVLEERAMFELAMSFLDGSAFLRSVLPIREAASLPTPIREFQGAMVPSMFFLLGLMRGLDHPNRRRIYQHLVMLPGDHFRSIVRTLRLGSGTVRHHLAILINQGIVRRDDRNGQVRYYIRGSESQSENNRLFMSHWAHRDVRSRILLALDRVKEARPSTLARDLGTSRQLVSYHLARLADTGSVRRVGERYRRA
ncbi:MAG: ArsR family transcriptional regulator [Thermoplasmata archaeon]|nr:ArsR family transcriptional regulator [Thermoplasmata archaeon]